MWCSRVWDRGVVEAMKWIGKRLVGCGTGNAVLWVVK